MNIAIALVRLLSGRFRAERLSHVEYQALRRAKATRLDDERRETNYFQRGAETSSAGRRIIRELCSNAADACYFSESHLGEQKIIARALQIPREIPLFPSIWYRLYYAALRIFLLPQKWRIMEMGMTLRSIHTQSGREIVFLQLLEGLLQRCRSYSESLDFLLRRYHGWESERELEYFQFWPVQLIKAGWHLGMKNPTALKNGMEWLRNRIVPEYLLILVKEGIIAETSQLQWLEDYLKDEEYLLYSMPRFKEQDFLITVRILKARKVSASNIIRLLRWPDNLNPDALQSVLKQLDHYGISDVNALFESLEHTLWKIKSDTLRSLVEDAGMRDARLLAQCENIIEGRNRLSPAILADLKALGAIPEDLVKTQQILVKTSWHTESILCRMHPLRDTPFNLSFSELDQCTDYLLSGSVEVFDDFLNTLKTYGFNEACDVLLFQPVFPKILYNKGRFAELLEIALQKIPNLPKQHLVEWLLKATSAYYTSLEFIIRRSGVPITTVDDLNKAVLLSNISVPLLKYLINVRQLKTMPALKSWYHKEGKGAQRFAGREEYTEIERSLFADCSLRKNFLPLYGNCLCVETVAYDYATKMLEKGKVDHAMPTLTTATHKELREEAREKMLPHLYAILNLTDGALVEGLLSATIDPTANFQEQLNKLNPTIDLLLKGKGPVSSDLDMVERDAVSLVYGVPTTDIDQLWSRVCGKKEHWKEINIADCYPMTWHTTMHILPELADSERDPLTAEIDSFDVAREFCDMLTAGIPDVSMVRRLRRKDLANPAASVREAAPYLGLLIAIASVTQLVRDWVKDHLSGFNNLLDDRKNTYSRLEALIDFLDVSLPDGLNAAGSNVVGTWPDEAVDTFTGIVFQAFSIQEAIERDRRNEFIKAVDLVSTRVLPIFEAWAKSLQNRCVEDNDRKGESIAVQGVVSKYPAAFFCRYPAQLCSREDTDMWDEERLAHLVVFDVERRRLAGMAMLYVEKIRDEYKMRPCLIIRAINTIPREGVSYDMVSVIEEMMRIAIDIARQNQLEAVLYPKDSTYFSNQKEVLKALSKTRWGNDNRVIRSNAAGIGVNILFYCREKQRRSEGVDSLYIAWESHQEG